MKVPLSATVRKNKETQEEKLVISRNGIDERINLPFKPFVLVLKDKFVDAIGPIEIWTKVPENILTEYTRLEFNTQNELREFLNRNKERKQYIFNNSYIEQILISHEDFFYSYPHTNDLIILFYDIEVATKGDGMFPKPINNEVLCIGYSIWKYYASGTKEKIKQCNINSYNEKDLDIKILEEFREIIKEEDPHIIADYNGTDFDIPYLIERYKLTGVSMEGIGRNNKEMYLYNNDVIIPGRIHFDIYASNSGVIKDQTLSGIKSKSLKELSRFYKIKQDDTELPHHIENLLKLWKEDPDLLYKYLDDDVLRTEGVGNVYIRNCITLAEMLGIPLNNVINMYSSLIPKLFIGRNMEKEKLINTETNFQRYNQKTGTIAKLGEKYQGALVGLYKDGFFPEVYKIDFAAMYSSAMQTWGLGPDTTELVEVRPYTGKYKFSRDSKYNWYNVPDENFKCNLLIKVRNDKEGFLSREISKLKLERKRLKGELKTCSPDHYDTIYSQQNAIKVILNSLYGIFGLSSSIYGDMIISLMITAMCRWTTGNVIRWYKDELIELDSVTGNTPIYVRNKITKHINIIPIEDLHESNDKRYKYIGPYEILTRNGWKNIRYTKKHLVNKNIYRIKISDGYVDVTEDHSLFNINKIEITPKDIICNETKIETCIIPSNNIVEDKFSNDMCWLLGFLIAEGSVYVEYTKNGRMKRQVSFNGNDIELMKKVEKISNKIFNTKSFGYSKFKLHNTLESSAVYKVQGGYNKTICSWLKNTCYTGNAKDKKVPEFIINGTKEMKEMFLEGLMIGDGYKTISKDNRNIESLDSKFKSLAAGVRYLWNSLNNETICNIRKDKENITVYRKRVPYSNGTLRKIDRNIVTQNRIICTNEYVYDVSTEDGTFVTALGDIVLHNTDGLILNNKVDEKEVNNKLNKLMKTKFNIDKNYMIMELEEFGRAYFYAMKNYVVQEGTKFIKHGVNFKSSKICKVVDRAIDLAISHWFNNVPKDQVIREAYDFKDLGIEWFVERVKLSKEQVDYDDQTNMRLLLAKQVEMKTGQVCKEGTQIHYVITKSQLPFKELKQYYKKGAKWNYVFIKYVDNISNVNISYYEQLIDKVLGRFGIVKNEQINLFKELNVSTRVSLNKKPLDVVPEDEI